MCVFFCFISFITFQSIWIATKLCIYFGKRKKNRSNSDLNAIPKRKPKEKKIVFLWMCVRCTVRFFYRFFLWTIGYWFFFNIFCRFFLVSILIIYFGYSKFSKFVLILKMHFDLDINRKKKQFLLNIVWNITLFLFFFISVHFLFKFRLVSIIFFNLFGVHFSACKKSRHFTTLYI